MIGRKPKPPDPLKSRGNQLHSQHQWTSEIKSAYLLPPMKTPYSAELACRYGATAEDRILHAVAPVPALSSTASSPT
jgi:hypothetical protein